MALPKHIGIVGSRSFAKLLVSSPHPVFVHINTFVSKLSPETTIISGGAIGVDRWAEAAAKKRNLKTIIKYPSEDLPIPARFFTRNTDIVRELAENKGTLVAFIDVNSYNGTRDTIKKAKARGVPVLVYKFTLTGKYVGEGLLELKV